jgi:glucoamylase
LDAGKTLRVELLQPALIRWSSDHWQTSREIHTTENALGIHLADLPVTDIPPDNTIVFTFFWPDAERWENVDFTVGIEEPGA